MCEHLSNQRAGKFKNGCADFGVIWLLVWSLKFAQSILDANVNMNEFKWEDDDFICGQMCFVSIWKNIVHFASSLRSLSSSHQSGQVI
jgi:hypothetical protein